MAATEHGAVVHGGSPDTVWILNRECFFLLSVNEIDQAGAGAAAAAARLEINYACI